MDMSQFRFRLRSRDRRRRSVTRQLVLEAMESRPLLAPLIFVVSNTGDNGGSNPAPFSGTGTLRQAIVDANSNPGPDNIEFAIAASTVPLLNVPVSGFDPVTQTWTIQPLSQLPNITDQVTIDGYTQAHFPIGYRYPSGISSSTQTISIVG